MEYADFVKIKNHELLLDAITAAREYDKTKSITTATEVCNMLIDWADASINRDRDDEQ